MKLSAKFCTALLASLFPFSSTYCMGSEKKGMRRLAACRNYKGGYQFSPHQISQLILDDSIKGWPDHGKFHNGMTHISNYWKTRITYALSNSVMRIHSLRTDWNVVLDISEAQHERDTPKYLWHKYVPDFLLTNIDSLHRHGLWSAFFPDST